MWHPTLWKQNTTYYLYEVNNASISSFKKLIHGPNTSRLYLEETSFLDKRGRFEAMQNFNIISLYCSREKPSYLPYYVSDKILLLKYAININFGTIYLMRRGNIEHLFAMENWGDDWKKHTH